MTSVRFPARTPRRRLGAASAGLVAVTTFGLLAGLTGTASAAATKVDLGEALDFGVMATAGITNQGETTVEDDIGSDDGSITGAEAGQADTIVLTGGGVNRGNDTGGAQGDLDAAYLAISAQGNGQVVGTADLGARQTEPLTPDVYSSGSSLNIDTPLVLDGQGSYDSVFIFRAGSALNTGTDSTITLLNGAQSCNVFWQVGSSADLLGATFAGNVLAAESISLGAAVTVDGRLLAGGAAVTLINDTITQSECRSGQVAVPPVVLPPVVTPPPVTPPPVTPPVTTPTVIAPPATTSPTTAPPTGSPTATAGPAGPADRTTYGQVRRVPVGSVDTGDGSTS